MHTYSIVARDPETGQLGVAVQTHAFAVGTVVPWAESGVGAVATQSLTEPSYGPLGLAMMRAGKSATQALGGLLGSDPRAEVRQVAMADAKGEVATHTGSRCIPEAGHRSGKQYSVQANLMLRDTVWDAMAGAYESASGDLAERMMVSLEAAEAEGGDIRGRQSAALLVVAGEPSGQPWRDRLFDLRVDDHTDPVGELRRLLATARADLHGGKAYDLLHESPLDEEKVQRAADEFATAMWRLPDSTANPEVIFWYAAALAEVGRIEEALELFRQVFHANPAWRDLVPRLARPGLIPDDSGLLQRILDVS
jgi:uncharacterized Ntn-hydrolase superfamily protein